MKISTGKNLLLLAILLITSVLNISVAAAAVNDKILTTDIVELAASSAPACPVAAKLPAGAELVDYIDCSLPNEDRPYAEDGYSQIATAAGVNYRQTSEAGNSFFAYKFAIGQINRPHIVVVEYPDDQYRTASIFLHESWMRGRHNGDFHIETGYSTGDEYPNATAANTDQMYQQMLIHFWPAEKYPAIVCLNLGHLTTAAISRIWVYQLPDSLEPVKLNTPKQLPQRKIGIFFEDSRMFSFNFGHKGGGEDHCAQYIKHTGQNLLSYDVVLYRYPKIDIPALPGNDRRLELALDACDKADIDFLAVFDPTKDLKIGETLTGDLSDDKAIDAWVKVIEQFVEKYSHHKSLTGISFGGPAGCNRMKSDKLPLLQRRINEMLQAKAPHITQHIYIGYYYLHNPPFTENKEYYPEKIIADWQNSAGSESFSETLARWVDKYYKSIHLDVDDYGDLKNVVINRSFYGNDHRCFRHYPYRMPRSMILRDMTLSDAVASVTDSEQTLGSCLFGSYFEITTPLFASPKISEYRPEIKNFWSNRVWIAPQVNPSARYFLENYTNALAKDDCTFMLNASWVNPISGAPHLVRDFARSYMTLPAIKFDTVARTNHVVARQLSLDGQLWFYLLNNSSDEAAVTAEFAQSTGAITELTGGKKISGSNSVPKALKLNLAPYQLACFKIDRENSLENIAVIRPQQIALHKRINELSTLIRSLEDSGQHLPDAYENLYRQTQQLFAAGRYQQADQLLGWTVINDLRLRKFLASGREIFICPRVKNRQQAQALLNQWNAQNSHVSIDDISRTTCDHWIFNQWRGAGDLSARIWACHDDTNLYLAFDVVDDFQQPKDGITIAFDTQNYKNPDVRSRPARVFNFTPPADKSANSAANNDHLAYNIEKTDSGYRGIASISLKHLGVASAASTSFGIHILLSDNDSPQPLLDELISPAQQRWRVEKRMEWPYNPYYRSDLDAQSCGVIRLE